MNTIVQAQPLTSEAFAPFGDVISCDERSPTRINYGQTERYGPLAALDVTREMGEPVLSIYRTKPLPLPLCLGRMERHKLGSQAFFPLSNRPWAVAVAVPGEFVATQVQVFLCSGEQGVNFHAGTWHHFSLALGAKSEFLVIDRTAPAGDCEEVTLNPPIQVELPA